MKARLKMFCNSDYRQLEKQINEWLTSDEFDKVHLPNMKFASSNYQDQVDEPMIGYLTVIIPYEPKTKPPTCFYCKDDGEQVCESCDQFICQQHTNRVDFPDVTLCAECAKMTKADRDAT